MLLGIVSGSLYQPGKVKLAFGSTKLKDVTDDTPIYRGIPAGHHRYNEATEGIAIPGDPEGHTDVELHNAGGTRDSQFTSWSTEPTEAADRAGRGGPGGIILRTTLREVQAQGLELWASPDDHLEEEILVRGTLRGADVEFR